MKNKTIEIQVKNIEYYTGMAFRLLGEGVFG